jgi:hypothetical protein
MTTGIITKSCRKTDSIGKQLSDVVSSWTILMSGALTIWKPRAASVETLRPRACGGAWPRRGQPVVPP